MKRYKYVLIVIALFLMFFNSVLPPALGLSRSGMSIVCIFLGTLILLMGVSLTWPAFLMVLAFAFNDVYSISTALQMSLGHKTVWLVALCGILMGAISRTGLLRRMALFLIKRPTLQKDPWLLLGGFFLTLILLGSVMNVTAVCILFSSLAGEILQSLGVKKGDRFGELMFMGVLVFSGLSYCITPFAHSTPILAIDMMGAEFGRVNYLQYSLVGYACILLVFAMYLLISKFIFKMDVNIIRRFDPATLGEVPHMSKREKASAVIYFGVVLLWFLPGVFEYICPPIAAFMNKIGEIAPVIAAIVLMVLLRFDGEPLMDFETELKNSIPWEAVLSMAAAMMLSSALSDPDAGITGVLAANVAPMLKTMPPYVIVLLLCLFCCILTCYASDTISATLACALFTALYHSGVITEIDPRAMAIVFGCVASCGFASPAGSTYGAVVYGTGWMRMKTQLLQGTAYSVGAALVFATFGYIFAGLLL